MVNNKTLWIMDFIWFHQHSVDAKCHGDASFVRVTSRPSHCASEMMHPQLCSRTAAVHSKTPQLWSVKRENLAVLHRRKESKEWVNFIHFHFYLANSIRKVLPTCTSHYHLISTKTMGAKWIKMVHQTKTSRPIQRIHNWISVIVTFLRSAGGGGCGVKGVGITSATAFNSKRLQHPKSR